MILKRLKLKNFAQHRDVDVTLNGNLIGILGHNGCGKSNLLNAIRFAFTGDSDGNKESMITQGLPEKERKGMVELWFAAQGKEGYIKRALHSQMREFRYGDEVYKKDEDIRKALQALFGMDTDMMRNLTFIRQGELQKLLFGDASDREMNFVKIFGLGHTEKARDALLKSMKELEDKAVDCTQLLDEKKTDWTRLSRELAALEFKIVSAPDSHKALAAASASLETLRKTLEAFQTFEKNRDEAFRIKKELADLEPTGKDLAATKQQDITKENELTLQFQQIQQTQMAVKVKQDLLTDLVLRKKVLEDLQVAIAAAQVKFNQLELPKVPYEEAIVLLQNTQARVAADAAIAQLKLEIDSEHIRREKLADQLAQLAGSKPADKHDELWKEYSNLSTELKFHEDLMAVLDAPHAEKKGRCILCGSKIEDAVKLKVSLTILCSAIQAKRATVGTTMEAEKLARTKWEAANNSVTSDLQAAETKINDLEFKLGLQKNIIQKAVPCLSADEEYKTLTRLIPNYDLKQRYEMQFGELLSKRAVAVESHNGIVRSLATMENIPVTAPDSSVIVAQLKEVAERRRLLADYELKANRLTGSFTQADMAQVTAYLAVAGKDRPTAEQLMAAEKTVQEATEASAAADQLVGVLQARKQELEACNARVRELQAQKDRSEKIFALKAHFEKVRDVLARGNLPLTFIQQYFAHLVPVLQGHLVTAGADFTVHLDKAEQVSFAFDKLDGSVSNMPVDKLSGGQKVRLVVAFLMALHEMMSSKMGFLILDEPTVFLDEAGVESFGELLTDLTHRLVSADMQVLISTHETSLKSSFTETIVIGHALQNKAHAD